MVLKENFLKFSSMGIIAFLFAILSCQKEEERLTIQDTADITEEAITDSYFQDMDDLTGIAIDAPTEQEYSGGRTSGSITVADDRFNCEGIIISLETDPASTADHPKGILTIDFGTGCEDVRGNVRKGKLIFSYEGKKFTPGATVVTTTDNYYINDVKLEGTRTLTNVQSSTSSAPRFNVVLTGGKATFPNEMTATRESNITWQWNRAENPVNDNLQIDASSTASGTTHSGRQYAVNLLEDIIFQRHCGMAVSGVKRYVINGSKEITIDYGDGTCDRSITITVNGETKNITL